VPTRILEYQNGKRHDYEVKPEDFGIEPLPFTAVSAPNGVACTAIARDMLAGEPKTEHYQLVLVNAAFIYTKFVKNIPLPEAYQKMEALLRTGIMGTTLASFTPAEIVQ
jgi:anthranilate phosphoribosyltransferase